MRLDRLDKAFIAVTLLLLVLMAVVILRGDQVGVQITQTRPAANAVNVPTRGLFAIAFSEPMDAKTLDGRVHVTPPLSGTLRWNGNTAFFVATQPLQQDAAYTITVQAGAKSARGRELLRDATWSFRTGHPRVLYLAPASGVGDLFVQDVASDGTSVGSPRRLTSEPYGVYDFAVSPDGARIVYSVNREDKDPERDLWIIDISVTDRDGAGRERLITCNLQVCQSPSWSADGTRIAFERRNLIQGAVGRSPGPSRIWVIDVETKQAQPLFEDGQMLGSLPHWAPAGDQLAYYDPTENFVTVIDTVKGDRVQLPSQLGDSGTWSPDANQIIYSELEAADDGRFTALLRAELVRDIITPVLPISSTNDSSAAWSPIGDRVAFGRQQRTSVSGQGILGPQLWVTAPDGADSRALTNDPEYSHLAFAWSPDGEWIATQRYHLLEINAKPEVWLIKADGSIRRKLAEDAALPTWLP
jgi:Tol biopolymer transport system component